MAAVVLVLMPIAVVDVALLRFLVTGRR